MTRPKDTEQGTSSEHPLPPAHALRLAAAATGIMALFYFGCLLSLAVVALLTVVDIVIMVGAARFGLAGYMKAPVAALMRLFAMIAMSLNLTKGAEFQIPLQRQDGPELFGLVSVAAKRAQVNPPDRILLEMTDNAWVRLRGYRKGFGQCTLALGYDLLAILSTEELSAVLAHEMAHAKLVQRGYTGWLSNGIGRITQLASSLESWSGPQKGKRFFTAEILAKGVQALAHTGCRLFAAYSRQNEFAADRLAALTSGSAAYARTLRTIHMSGIKGADLSWRERLVQIQRDESFPDWLRSRLTPKDSEERSLLEQHALKPRERSAFSTHPLLADRLAALPPAQDTEQNNENLPALSLLHTPEATAARLMAEIERTAMSEEHKESERLRRWVQKKRRRTKHTPGEYAGLSFLLIGFILLVFTVFSYETGFASGPSSAASRTAAAGLTATVFLFAAAVACLRFFRFRERVPLPIPRFGVWQQAMKSRDIANKVVAESQTVSMVTSLRGQQPDHLRRRRDRACYWSQRAYHALSQGEFQQAGAASRLCLEVAPRSLEGRLAGGIAAAYTGHVAEVNRLLGKAVGEYGVGPGTSAAMGCALTMLANWQKGEAYLHDAVERRPDEATLWSLLALCQWKQSRPREAIQSARLGVSRASQEAEHHLLLLQLLFAAGQIRDAQEELTVLETSSPENDYLPEARLRLALSRNSLGAARGLAERWEEAQPGPLTQIQIADLFLAENQPEVACRYLEKASEEGFYPEALVGLARLAFTRGDKDRTRSLLCQAADLTRDVPSGAETPLDLIGAILGGLQALRDPEENCREGKAEVQLTQTEITQQSSAYKPPVTRVYFIACAVTRQQADDSIRELFSTLFPNAVLDTGRIQWQFGTGVDKGAMTMPPGVYWCGFER